MDGWEEICRGLAGERLKQRANARTIMAIRLSAILGPLPAPDALEPPILLPAGLAPAPV